MKQDFLKLPGGRFLCYNVHGPGDGRPVLYFHGTPSSRLEPLLPSIYDIDVISLLHKYNLQLIAVDRPGMGRSTFHAQSDFLSFADDVAELIKQKDIRTCPVIGWSGGGPYALGMACKYPGLIEASYILAGFTISMSTPGVYKEMTRNKYYFRSAQNTPVFLKLILDYLARKEIKRTFRQFISGLPDADYFYLKNVRHLKQVAAITIQEACRNGSAGSVREAASYFGDFGFTLNAIKKPVHYWWGSEDKEVITRHLLAIVQEVPHHKIYFKKGEGHVSIYVRYIEEVLSAIADNK